ncbi:unnamed protein product [Closterium sp. NIES-53]
MDAEMASWESTGTYVNEVPPSGANIVSGMWIFRGSLHEEIWLRRPPGFTGSFPAGTQWSLRRPVYGLRQAPREWHDTLRTTLAALGFAPSNADPSLFLRTDANLKPFYVLVYVDDLVFATADTEALAHVKSELSFSASASPTPRHIPLLCLPVTRSQLLQQMHVSSCEAEIYAGAMAAQELRWLTYLLTDLGEAPRSPPVLYVDNKAMLALCQEHRLEHRTKHIALRYFLAREVQQRGQLRLAYVASQANTADVFTKALQPCDHQPCFGFLDWSCDLLFSLTLPMGAARTRAAEAIRKANVIAKCNADRHRIPVTYQPDDLVLLDTQILRLPITPKLRPRYCGPFRISHMITPIIAHLLLPADRYVSPSFHVSLLRPYIPSTSQLSQNRLASMTRPPTEPVITPEKILSHRVRDPRGARKVEFLIRWRDRTPTEDSWVPLDKIKNHPVLTEYLRSRNFQDIHALS